VKEFLKSINISRRYGQKFVYMFSLTRGVHGWHPRHYDVISANAQGGNTGTFSMLFRMVLRSSPPIFSFVLIFSKLGQNMSQ